MTSNSREQENIYISMIRDEVTMKPDITLRVLQVKLEVDKNIHLSLPYLMKLREKVYKQKLAHFNRITLNRALADMGQSYQLNIEKLYDVAMDKKTSNRDRIAALKEIRESKKTLFEKCWEAGVFDKQPDDAIFNNKLGDNTKVDEIIQAMINFGTLKAGDVIDDMPVITVEANVQENTQGSF